MAYRCYDAAYGGYGDYCNYGSWHNWGRWLLLGLLLPFGLLAIFLMFRYIFSLLVVSETRQR